MRLHVLPRVWRLIALSSWSGNEQLPKRWQRRLSYVHARPSVHTQQKWSTIALIICCEKVCARPRTRHGSHHSLTACSPQRAVTTARSPCTFPNWVIRGPSRHTYIYIYILGCGACTWPYQRHSKRQNRMCLTTFRKRGRLASTVLRAGRSRQFSENNLDHTQKCNKLKLEIYLRYLQLSSNYLQFSVLVVH